MNDIQIAGYSVLRLIDRLHVLSLHRDGLRLKYWYMADCNLAGIITLLCGSAVYMWLPNPLTFIPNYVLFQYTGATMPAAPAGAGVCPVGMRLMGTGRG